MSFGDLGQRSLVICLSAFSKDFSTETTRPISFIFHMQPPDKKEKKKECIWVGHVASKVEICEILKWGMRNFKIAHISTLLATVTLLMMATMPIFDGNLKYIYFFYPATKVYKRSVSSYIKQISHCSLSVQGSDQDLMVLLLLIL